MVTRHNNSLEEVLVTATIKGKILLVCWFTPSHQWQSWETRRHQKAPARWPTSSKPHQLTLITCRPQLTCHDEHCHSATTEPGLLTECLVIQAAWDFSIIILILGFQLLFKEALLWPYPVLTHSIWWSASNNKRGLFGQKTLFVKVLSRRGHHCSLRVS